MSPVHPYGCADLLVGVDLLEAARSVDSSLNLRVAAPDRTACVVNSTRHPTTLALMGREDWDPEHLEASLKARSKPDAWWSGEVSPICQAYLGSTLYDNSLLMGVAFQQGLLPVTAKSLHKALKLAYTGLARTRNIQAFNLGRDMVANPGRYGRPLPEGYAAFANAKQSRLAQDQGAGTAQHWRDSLEAALKAWPVADDAERKHLALCSYELCYFEDLRLAQSYLDRVLAVAAKDSAAAAWKATRAAARGIYKALAIKDEVWVAHLLSSPEKYERDAQRLGLDPSRGDTVEYLHYNRPHFDVFGFKLEFDLNTRDWMLSLMKRAKFLRRLLPGWHVREKAFRDWYLALVAAYPGVAQDPDLKWAQALGGIETVRGYRAIRYVTMDAYKQRVKALVGWHP